MPGVTIGDGAIIASKSVVSKNVAPYTIAGGNPAQIIRPRFTAETITLLLELQWWNWNPYEIAKYADVLLSNDLAKLRALLKI